MSLASTLYYIGLAGAAGAVGAKLLKKDTTNGAVIGLTVGVLATLASSTAPTQVAVPQAAFAPPIEIGTSLELEDNGGDPGVGPSLVEDEAARDGGIFWHGTFGGASLATSILS